MPPLHPGDPGDERGEDGDDSLDESLEFRPPLPPEDRIWRHPSEVAAAGAGAAAGQVPRWRRQNTQLVGVAALSALIGATLSLGVVAALGGFDRETQFIERQTAVQPITGDPSRNDTVAAITDRTAPAVVSVRVDRDGTTTAGSAVVYRSDGHLLTNAHLVDGAGTILVYLHDGRSSEATVVGTDPLTDVAVLRVDAADLDPAPMGSADSLRVGDTAIAIGCAGDGGWSASVATGLVSAIDRRMRTSDGRTLHGMILLDTRLSTPAAGGPLVDRHGAVVGLTNSEPEEAAPAMATPVDLVRHVADQLIAHGRARHVWLGVEGEDLDTGDAMAMGVDGGAAVSRVLDDSPAAVAGLAPGDIVVSVGDRDVHSMSELIRILRTHQPDDAIRLTVRRGDDVLRLSVVLAERG